VGEAIACAVEVLSKESTATITPENPRS